MDIVGASPADKIRLLEAEIDRLEERNKQLKTAIRKALLNIIMLEDKARYKNALRAILESVAGTQEVERWQVDTGAEGRRVKPAASFLCRCRCLCARVAVSGAGGYVPGYL